MQFYDFIWLNIQRTCVWSPQKGVQRDWRGGLERKEARGVSEELFGGLEAPLGDNGGKLVRIEVISCLPRQKKLKTMWGKGGYGGVTTPRCTLSGAVGH